MMTITKRVWDDMKKSILGLLTALLIIVGIVAEFQKPAASAETYYVSVKKAGKVVHHSNFRGYMFKEQCVARNGERRTIKFLSSKSLKQNKKYKVIIQANKLLVNATPIKDNNETAVKYLDKK